MNTKRRIVGIIPSRYNSTRLPGKPLVSINGVCLIERVFVQAKKSKELDDVLIATDDKRVFEKARGFGAKVVMTSALCKSGTDRLSEVARKYEKNARAFINIQGDEPLIDPGLIDTLARELKKPGCPEMVTAAFPIKSNEEFEDPNVNKVVLDKDGNAIYFSRSPIPYPRKPGNAAPLKHLGIYGYSRSFLLKYSSLKQTPLEISEQLEQLRAIENGYKIRVVIAKKDSAGVDTPDDVKKVEKILRNGALSKSK
jgi:3-deoxy-manno-octulosonate cytidylyltransferase (CMP-KDO synthetase)